MSYEKRKDLFFKLAANIKTLEDMIGKEDNLITLRKEIEQAEKNLIELGTEEYGFRCTGGPVPKK